MTTINDFSSAAHVKVLDESGKVLARVPASLDADALNLHLTHEDARACWTLRLIDATGKTLAEVPTRHSYEVQRFAAGLIEQFREGQA